MPRFKVLSPIEHNGKGFAPGKPIDLTDDEAAPLLAVNAVADPKASKDAAAADTEGDAK